MTNIFTNIPFKKIFESILHQNLIHPNIRQLLSKKTKRENSFAGAVSKTPFRHLSVNKTTQFHRLPNGNSAPRHKLQLMWTFRLEPELTFLFTSFKFHSLSGYLFIFWRLISASCFDFSSFSSLAYHLLNSFIW